MANPHKRRNTIERIRIGGEWLIGEENVRIGIVNSFKELLIDPGGWRASPEDLNFSRIDDFEAVRLEVPFTEEEVFLL